MTALLEVKNLHVQYPLKSNIFAEKKVVHAVNGVDLRVDRGQALGIVGESGCGKSTLARAIIGLEPIHQGQVLFEGTDLTKLNHNQLRAVRKDIQMVYQDPYTSLNPKMTVAEIISAPLKAYKYRKNITYRVKELMSLVGLNPDIHYDRYPHAFSGGQRQRIGIARALALEPKLLICDEPVSALDVSVQAQIINLFEDLQKELGLAYFFIAHDLSVVHHIADQVMVMYLGQTMEYAEREALYDRPAHPYSKALLSSIPLPDPIREASRQQIMLKGDLPSITQLPQGCAFASRCPFATDYCHTHQPALEEIADQQNVACFYPISEKHHAK